MPRPPLPPFVEDVVRRPNPAVVATVRPDGTPHTAATWYDWEDGRLLLNMDASRLRLRFLRANPTVAVTILDSATWYRHVSLLGVAGEITEDVELADIDRLSRRYTGAPYAARSSRRYSTWMTVTAWHSWDVSGPMGAPPSG